MTVAISEPIPLLTVPKLTEILSQDVFHRMSREHEGLHESESNEGYENFESYESYDDHPPIRTSFTNHKHPTPAWHEAYKTIVEEAGRKTRETQPVIVLPTLVIEQDTCLVHVLVVLIFVQIVFCLCRRPTGHQYAPATAHAKEQQSLEVLTV
jgi:hypothetical protein